MERKLHSKTKTSDLQNSETGVPSQNPEVFIEATLHCLHEAITDPSIDISEWRNQPMKKLVQMYRDQEAEIQELAERYQQVTTLHIETKKAHFDELNKLSNQ